MYKQGRVARAPVISNDERFVSFITKPPKPPSWRDFLPDSTSNTRDRTNKNSLSVDFTDLNLVQRSHDIIEMPSAIPAPTTIKCDSPLGHAIMGGSNVGTSLDGGGRSSTQSALSVTSSMSARPSELHKHRKKTKAHIHRTRSRMSIHDSELPAEVPKGNLAVPLATSKSREFGLKKKHIFDDRVYLDDNRRRCQRWLASLEVAEPLEDVAFAQGSGVDVIIPEECSPSIRATPGYESPSSSDQGSGKGHQSDDHQPMDGIAKVTCITVQDVESHNSSQYLSNLKQSHGVDLDKHHWNPPLLHSGAISCHTKTDSSFQRSGQVKCGEADTPMTLSLTDSTGISPVEEVDMNLPGMSTGYLPPTELMAKSDNSAVFESSICHS